MKAGIVCLMFAALPGVVPQGEVQAQYRTPDGFATQTAAPHGYTLPPVQEHGSPILLFTAGAGGAAVGAVAGAALGSALGGVFNSEACPPLGGEGVFICESPDPPRRSMDDAGRVALGVLAESTLLATAVHLVNHKRGRAGATLTSSLVFGVLGGGLATLFYYEDMETAAAITASTAVALQLTTAVAAERVPR